MKKSSIALAALLLAMGSASLSAVSPAYAQEKKEPSKVEVIRAEWSKPYTEIQKLIGDKQYAEAMTKIEALNAFENKTPYEKFFLSRTKAVVASSTGDNALLAKCFEEMVGSEFLPPADKARYIEAMAGIFFNEKKYAESLVWTKRALEYNKDSTLMQDMLARNYYLLDDFASTITEVKKQIDGDLAAKRVPTIDRLRILHGAYAKTKNSEGVTAMLELLVTYHPTREYWADLLYRLPSKPGFSDRLRLDWYRLLYKSGNMEDDTQYMEMAEIALLAGLPLEAKDVLENGFKAGFLGKGKNAAKHKPLLDKATKQAADDAKSLDAGETAARASKTGLGMVNMGYNFVIHGQVERGIGLIEAGIAKGGLKAPEEAKLHLGMAYLVAGNRAKAEEVLKTVAGNDGAPELARYWLLYKQEAKQ
ncbi:hypothetical protein RF679_01625 [Undibacterium cyanobacteriorum]|uniref:Tetratricopeptide repeat protein n=1 Tax=Undibacterium cyanobacteriorum TaxID=3073561 RepID=A0ABY9RL58_9BURK|nr:hypothetical protein [Undibacterium sp. 20NA77.5]WMW80995.1 hypothetical protein RF679_01625 [Undibacterium sp. 20NA77.5]